MLSHPLGQLILCLIILFKICRPVAGVIIGVTLSGIHYRITDISNYEKISEDQFSKFLDLYKITTLDFSEATVDELRRISFDVFEIRNELEEINTIQTTVLDQLDSEWNYGLGKLKKSFEKKTSSQILKAINVSAPKLILTEANEKGETVSDSKLSLKEVDDVDSNVFHSLHLSMTFSPKHVKKASRQNPSPNPLESNMKRRGDSSIHYREISFQIIHSHKKSELSETENQFCFMGLEEDQFNPTTLNGSHHELEESNIHLEKKDNEESKQDDLKFDHSQPLQNQSSDEENAPNTNIESKSALYMEFEEN